MKQKSKKNLNMKQKIQKRYNSKHLWISEKWKQTRNKVYIKRCKQNISKTSIEKAKQANKTTFVCRKLFFFSFRSKRILVGGAQARWQHVERRKAWGFRFRDTNTHIQAKFGKMHFFESRESKLEGAGFFQKQPISALAKKPTNHVSYKQRINWRFPFRWRTSRGSSFQNLAPQNQRPLQKLESKINSKYSEINKTRQISSHQQQIVTFLYSFCFVGADEAHHSRPYCWTRWQKSRVSTLRKRNTPTQTGKTKLTKFVVGCHR